MTEYYEEGEIVELRNVKFQVKVVNNHSSEPTYELDSDYGTLDFVPPKNVTKRVPRAGDVYKVLGGFANNNVYLHLLDATDGSIKYFRTDDPGEVTHVSWLDLSETELVLEGP